MDNILKFLADLKLGEPKTHGNMTAIPLLGRDDNGPDYLILGEAIEVTEIDKAVPRGNGDSLLVLQDRTRPGRPGCIQYRQLANQEKHFPLIMV
jgi:hypothetical protein